MARTALRSRSCRAGVRSAPEHARSFERARNGGGETGGRPMLTTHKRHEPSGSFQAVGRRPGVDGEPAERDEAHPVADLAVPDDFSREVYCILGVPLDAVGMTTTLRRIEAAARRKTRYLISTPNLNTFVTSRSDREFGNRSFSAIFARRMECRSSGSPGSPESRSRAGLPDPTSSTHSRRKSVPRIR